MGWIHRQGLLEIFLAPDQIFRSLLDELIVPFQVEIVGFDILREAFNLLAACCQLQAEMVHNAAQAGVAGLPHFAHAAGADGGEDFVWAEFFTDHQ